MKGIANLYAVTCYINTTLQCLGHIDIFRNFVISRDGGILFNSLKDVYETLYVKDKDIVPNRLIQDMRLTMNQIDFMDQNDINEFLSLFIDRLHKEICYKNDSAVVRNGNSTYEKLRYFVDLAWKEQNKDYSELTDMFYGQHIYQTMCDKCGHICHNYEPFLNITLPISNDTETVEDCLKVYFGIEHINTWKCDRCANKTNNEKSIKLWRTPQILILSLNRFHCNKAKVTKMIKPPISLDISRYSINGNSRYRLISVANHFGNLHGGHYNALLERNGSWTLIDDLNVHNIDESESIWKAAYVFFYQRV